MARARNQAGRFTKMVPMYEVTVWNTNTGDIAERNRNATEADLRELETSYDEPWFEVIVDREWEEPEDDA